METMMSILLACLLPLSLSACAPGSQTVPEGGLSSGEQSTSVSEHPGATEETQREGEETMEWDTFYVTVGGETFEAVFADNAGAQALGELLAEEPITIQMSDYAGFEKVGALGQSLPTSNRQTTAQAGDIVLYQGNQIVLFYGSNAWNYTPLGRIKDLTGWEAALGSRDVSVTFSQIKPK